VFYLHPTGGLLVTGYIGGPQQIYLFETLNES
jgi:hypothetical protein